MNSIIPICRVPINVRVAAMADLPFIDRLQKMHSKMVGWMPTKQLEGKIAAGQVIVAEESVDCGMLNVDGGEGAPFQQSTINHQQSLLGYCIFRDQYFKRDDVGIIYQLNVLPGKQRSFIGATLIKAMFDRAAYGCRLFCCWCAQDIEANYFWESLGFVPLAFRAGSRQKSRVHIFWQKRVRAGDTTTPYWFPSQTTGGSIREDRLVFPIPPGTRWSDAKPIVLPGMERKEETPKRLPGPRVKPAPVVRRETHVAVMGGVRFIDTQEKMKVEKPKPEPRKKLKNDPMYVAAARELRDRYLERINTEPLVLQGKYDVCKALRGPEMAEADSMKSRARELPLVAA